MDTHPIATLILPIRLTPTLAKVCCSPKKMLKMCDRSRNVYEIKQNMDKIPGEKSDVNGKSMQVLQRKTVLW